MSESDIFVITPINAKIPFPDFLESKLCCFIYYMFLTYLNLLLLYHGYTYSRYML